MYTSKVSYYERRLLCCEITVRTFAVWIYIFLISIIIFIVAQTDFVKLRDHSHGPAVACLLIKLALFIYHPVDVLT